MPGKVLIPQDVSACGKDFLLEKGYKIKMGTGEDEASIIRDVVDCDAILARTAPLTKRVMDAGKKIKVISRAGVGVDSIDCAYAAEKGIWVTNAPTSNKVSVAEQTIFLILSCAKNARIVDTEMRKGNYDVKNQVLGQEVRGKVLGLLGLGRIGQEVGKMAARGLEMKVIGYDPYVNKDTLLPEIKVVAEKEEVLKTSDYVSLHFPCTAETINSIGMKEFEMMKDSAFLINSARGELVREKELIEALKHQVINGAGLDVTVKEPIEMDNELLELRNAVITPHYAAMTVEARDRMAYYAAFGIDEVLSGKRPTWSVNRPVGF